MSLSFMYPLSNTEKLIDPISVEMFEGTQMIWQTDWLNSGTSAYGKGNFFYRLSRSQFAIDKSGNYLYEIHFISDSYYQAASYDVNRNGVIEDNEVYRCATKIDQLTLYVNNQPYLNTLSGSSTFWVLFQGNYPSGLGEVRVSFTHNTPNAQVYIKWSQPIPY